MSIFRQLVAKSVQNSAFRIITSLDYLHWISSQFGEQIQLITRSLLSWLHNDSCGLDVSNFNSFVNLMKKFRKLTASDLCKFPRWWIPFMISNFRLYVSLISNSDKKWLNHSALLPRGKQFDLQITSATIFTSTKKYQSSYLCRVPFPHDSSIPVCPLVILSVSFRFLQFDSFLIKETNKASD